MLPLVTRTGDMNTRVWALRVLVVVVEGWKDVSGASCDTNGVETARLDMRAMPTDAQVLA